MSGGDGIDAAAYGYRVAPVFTLSALAEALPLPALVKNANAAVALARTSAMTSVTTTSR